MLVKILDSTYAKSDPEQVAANATQMKSEEISQRLSLLEYFKEIFGGTLWDWYTEPVDPELKTYYKPFNCKYYPVHRINRETFWREIQFLFKIGVLTLVQQRQ